MDRNMLPVRLAAKCSRSGRAKPSSLWGCRPSWKDIVQGHCGWQPSPDACLVDLKLGALPSLEASGGMGAAQQS